MRIMGRLKASYALCALMVAAAVGPAAAEMESGWKGGLFMKDPDKGYEIKFGGRIMNDYVGADVDDSLRAFVQNPIEDGTALTVVRMYTSGVVYHVVEYKMQFDFSGGRVRFRDMYMGLRDIPVLGTLRVGQQYDPIGMETLTSSNYILFPFRSPVTTLMPNRRTGVAAMNHAASDRIFWAAGIFTPSNDAGGYSGTERGYTARVTGLPMYAEKGRHLVHVGVGASYRESPGGVYEVTVKPDHPNAPTFLDTGDIPAKDYVLASVEALGIWGPLSLQGEYALSSVNSPDTGDPQFPAYYVQAAYTLTGEHRGYKDGIPRTITPKNNFDGKGGAGAWELAARFSSINLNDGDVAGGELTVASGGVNWYLNPNTRVMAGYGFTDFKDVGQMHTLLVRFHVYF